jgi:hypothetical protein
MPTKFERELEEILSKAGAGSLKPQKPSALARVKKGLGGGLHRVKQGVFSLPVFDVRAMLPLGFLLLLTGLVLRSVDTSVGTIMTFVAIGLLIGSYIAYLVRPSRGRGRRRWRGRDLP